MLITWGATKVRKPTLTGRVAFLIPVTVTGTNALKKTYNQKWFVISN